ncbi:nli interacting factor-like phosphatase family protein [Stylonychia lemnae]|uniref:Nli interacting factor-like phosphatase family protein n=1 Tax=Stylonychia lemnae TaxID=5949 RepID=A0A077ZU60_STYLE|nr:nli interacting factor-like phosphatase family protein [Stylonychia lemnae]|eukprot:CDW73412.1 nli interacting factor-like phosphatase family protein [Stylonychia lemnae]
MYSKDIQKGTQKLASNQQLQYLNYPAPRKANNNPISSTPMKYISSIMNQENIDPSQNQQSSKKHAYINQHQDSHSQNPSTSSLTQAMSSRANGTVGFNKRGDSNPASQNYNQTTSSHGPLSEITQMLKNSQNHQQNLGRQMKSSSQTQQSSTSGSGIIVGSTSQPMLTQKTTSSNRVSGVFKIKQNSNNSSQQAKKNANQGINSGGISGKYAKNININNISNYNLQQVTNNSSNITVNLLSSSQTSRIHEYFQQAEVRRKNNANIILKKDQPSTQLQNAPTPSNAQQTSGGSTLEFDDDVDNLNCLASQVNNVVNGFEQRRFSEKNFKVFTNHIQKEGRNVSQIILELEESNQMKSTNDIHNPSSKIQILSSKIKKNSSTKAKEGQNILQNYLSNNSSQKSSKDQYSIQNYKTPNQSHLVNNTRETPQLSKGKYSETKNSTVGIPPSQAAADTRTLLSDHIKKHIRAQESPFMNKSKRPQSNLEGNSPTKQKEDSENTTPFKLQLNPSLRKTIKQSPEQNQFGQQFRHVMHQNYVNPQNTIANNTTVASNRISKLSANTTSGQLGDIGEETTRNQVNETKTIKDKLGTQQIVPTPSQSSHTFGFKQRQIEQRDQDENQNSSNSFASMQQQKRSSTNGYDMQPILDQERLFFELTKTIMNDKDTSQIDFNAMQGTTKQAFDFMRKILIRYGGAYQNQNEEKLINMYAQTCKIELVVQQLIKKIQNDIYPTQTQKQAGQSSGLVHNYMKNVIIHTHQNILYFLEIATLLIGGNSIQNLNSKLQGMKQNIETSLQSLQNICRIKRNDEQYFEDLLQILKRVEVMKQLNQSLQSFEGTLTSLDAKQLLDQTPIVDKKFVSKIVNSDHKAHQAQNVNSQIQQNPLQIQNQSAQKPQAKPQPQNNSPYQPKFLNPTINNNNNSSQHQNSNGQMNRHASTSPVNKRRSFILPELDNSRYQYTLVLDLDETLIHFEASEKKFKIRPNCITFLKTLSQYFEIVIFTAASQDYADWILDVLDPNKAFISHRLYRQHTQYDDGVYVKDLNLLGRDLKKTIIIDNIRENFERQDANGIEIVTWLNDPNDRELDNLQVFLKGLVEAQVKDVRPLINLFKAECWKSPTKKRKDQDVYAGDKVSPKGCTPHTDKKGSGLIAGLGAQTDAKFIR